MKIRIRDFVINIKLSFILLVIAIIALNIVGQFFILLILVALHELCHILVANFYGAICREIVITPAGFCAKIDMDDLSYCQKLIVLLSGPLFNIILGVVCGNVMSIALGVFNLLPVYPLDGGRILSCTMGYILGTLRANRYIVSISLFFCYVLVALGILQMALFWGNISLLLIAVFLYRANKNEIQFMTYNFYKAVIHKSNDRVMKVRSMVINKNIKLKTIIYRLGTDYYTIVYIRDGEIIGMISEDRLQNFIINNGISHRAVDLL